MAIVGMAVAIRTKEQLLLILKTIVFTSFVLATYNVIMNLNGLFNGALATHCYKLFFYILVIHIVQSLCIVLFL